MTTLLVIGGARSGKSRYAQDCIEAQPGRLAFIATAQRSDSEMDDRITRHQADRGPRWTTHEAPLELPAAIGRMQDQADAILVDCLTLWLSNLMLLDRDLALEANALVTVIAECEVPMAIVTNEVGQGIVPMNPLARRFRDEAGRLNQSVAAACRKVVLVTAGLPLVLK
jgi:adenosylcobinamide kinase/adenosylcobinamide-phosphate guanylyltransferase